jgi:ABC-type spermidine/putrescine transport system permease subunit II
VRWAAIALLAIEAALSAVYSFLLGSIAAAYWPGQLASHQSTALHRQSWLDLLTQVACLIAIVVIYVALPAAIALAAAGKRHRWLWAGVAYQLAWALLLTPPVVGFDPDISKVGLVGAILFGVAALGQRRKRARPRRASTAGRRG